ncbi:sigma-70 family RNA polymerase sigma factor [Microbacterium sp. NPDC055903]
MTSPTIPAPGAPDGDASDDRVDLSDEQLVDELRAGDLEAYEALWVRHVAAARRVAARIAPLQADDLVSEAFLTVFEQIHTQGKGPTSAFRAYLFAVIRNTGARWYREGSKVVNDPDVDDVFEDENLAGLEREYDGAVLLDAFRALPDRWQRVLWLTEIEDTGRAQIAAELGIRPNAVSALHRRARSGLRLQWLLRQVPAELRVDGHVGGELPAVIVGGNAFERRQLAGHLDACERCREAEAELRAVYRDGKKSAASVGGLAALGVVLPAASAFWAAPVTITVAAGLGMSFVSAAAVLLGAVGLGLGVDTFTSIAPPQDAVASVMTEVRTPDSEQHEEPVAIPATTPTPVAPVLPIPPPPVIADPDPESAPAIDIIWSPDGEGFAPRPPVTPPTEPGTVTPPGGEEAPPAPMVTTASPAATSMAPVLSGTAVDASDVAVGVGEDTYAVTPSDTGDWTFDVRGLALPAGDYIARVWTVTDGVASAASEMAFTIDAPLLEGILEIQSIPLGDAIDTGLPFRITAAPGETVCLESDTGQSAMVPLDSVDGSAQRRLRFFSYGMYVLRWSVCEDGYYGPTETRVVSIGHGLMDPWIVEDEPRWDIFED